MTTNETKTTTPPTTDRARHIAQRTINQCATSMALVEYADKTGRHAMIAYTPAQERDQ